MDILFQNFLIECTIHGSINYGKSSRSWSCKAAPDHHTTTTMFDCWCDFPFMKCCVGFTPDVMGHTPFKKSNSCLISPQNICQKVLGIITIFWANVRWAFVFFLVSSGFCLFALPSPMDAVFAQSLSYCWTLTIIEASEACSSLDVVLGQVKFNSAFQNNVVNHSYFISETLSQNCIYAVYIFLCMYMCVF